MMLRLLLPVFLAVAVSAADSPRAVPRPVAELLARAAKAEPAAVVRLVDGWSGEPHPLLLLVRAQAHWRMVPAPEALAAAERDFAAALALDASLRQAHLGLAQCAAAREDWPTAARHAGAGIDHASADAAQLAFLAQTAVRALDWRLAALAAQHGILRFPADQSLRRLELAVLVNAGREADVREAVLALLAHAPDDAQLWRHLAWAAQRLGRDDEALAAVEAALAVAPDDNALRRQLTQMQLAASLPQAALATARPLLADPATAEDAVVLLAVRAAADAGDLVQARAWLAAVPDGRRTRQQRLQAARLAVAAGDQAAAATAIDAVIAAGERDGTVLAWAASMAETRGEPARAEALYLQAAATEGPAAAPATLRLVAMYLRQDRRDEARALLATYLVQRPDDAQARALLAQVERTR